MNRTAWNTSLEFMVLLCEEKNYCCKFTLLNIRLNIQQMIEFEIIKIVHKTLHNEVPEYLQGLFTRVSDKCVRELRSSKLDLNLPLLKTSFGRKSFSFRGAKLWNKLGAEAKTTSSFSAFRKLLRKIDSIYSFTFT